MILQEITHNIYYLPLEEATDRPNLYYILGKNYSIAIDSGNSQKHCHLFYQGIMERDLPLPKYTIITHWHWDHTFGLKAIVGESICTSLTQKKLEEVSKWKWTKEEMEEREKQHLDIPFCNEHILVEYSDLSEISVKLCDIVIDKNIQLDLGDDIVDVIVRPSPHTDDSLFVYDHRDKCLFVGDGDGGDFYNNDQKYDKQKLIDLISFYKAIDYNIHCFSHSLHTTKEEALKDLGEILNDENQITQ